MDFVNEEIITIQDDTYLEGCSPHSYYNTIKSPSFPKEHSIFSPNVPQSDTQCENKNYSNNLNSNSIENKKTNDETIKIDEDFDYLSNIQEQKLSDITNNIIIESNPEKNEEDYINDSNINNIKDTSKKETECLKDKNEINKKQEISKSIPIFKVIYNYKHNSTFKINDVIKDESDGVLFYISLGIGFIHNKGRIPKNLKKMGVKGKHDNTSLDNGIREVLTSCKDNIHAFVKKLCLEEPYGMEIQSLNIKPQMGSKEEDYQKFFPKKLKFIYFDSIPKNIGKILNEERKKKGDKFIYEHNKPKITNVIVREGANKNIKNKILYTLSNEVSYGDMLDAYFNKEIKEIKKGNVSINLDNFRRYEDCLNDYDAKIKMKLRHKILEIKSNNIKLRASRKKQFKFG